MEEEEKNWICKHLPYLLSNTTCSDLFLSYFEMHAVLCKPDIEDIKSQGPLRYTAQAKKLYDILVQRKGSYQVLLQALNETKQSGVLAILEKLTLPKMLPAKCQNFVKMPINLNLFLEDSQLKVLILETLSLKITIDKILDNLSNVSMVTLVEMLASNFKLVNTTHVLVVQCKTETTLPDSLFERIKAFIGIKVILVFESNNVSKEWLTRVQKDTGTEISHDKIAFDDLSEFYKHKIVTRVQTKFAGVNISNCFRKFTEQNIIDLINDNEGDLLKSTLPRLPTYYVPRTILRSDTVSQSIFKYPTIDIWIFKNINDVELANLAGMSTTDSTSNQLAQHKLDCNFLTLDCKSDFDAICLKAEKSVHLIKVVEGSLHWSKTKGDVKEVLRSLDKMAEPIKQTEEEFIRELEKLNVGTKTAICISETPGMGKTCLFSKIGQILVTTYSDRLIVFVSLRDFMEMVKLIKTKSVDKSLILALLSKLVCQNNVAEVILECNSEKRIELMVDGFDEISSNDMSLANEIISFIVYHCDNVRVWISTRPHCLPLLQMNFPILGYNIAPFSDQDQLKFLTRFWKDKAIEKQKRLSSGLVQEFAIACLKTIKDRITNNDIDIAGVPLQCMMIGEVFSYDAIRYSTSQNKVNTDALPSFHVNNLMQLYEELVKTKIHLYIERSPNSFIDVVKIRETYIYFSLLLLYPSIAEKYKDSLFHNDIINSEHLKIGLMQADSTKEIPRFIHRTIAEYFVAEFIKNKIEGENIDETFFCLLFDNVLVVKYFELIIPYISDRFLSYIFAENTICYFLNSSFATLLQTKIGNLMKDILVPRYTVALHVHKLMHACVNSQFLNILKFFEATDAFTINKEVTSDKHLLFVIFYKCELRFASYCIELFDKYYDKLDNVCSNSRQNLLDFDSFDNKTSLCNLARQKLFSLKISSKTLLHVAVIRASYSITRYLLEVVGFRKSINKDDIDFDNLCHLVVSLSRTDSSTVLSEKRKILRLVADVNKSLINKDCHGNSPLVHVRVHVSLMEELIQLGSNPMTTTPENETLLHKLARRPTCAELYRILIFPGIQDSLSQLINMKDNRGHTILHELLASCTPQAKTLKFLKERQADFNAVSILGYSPIFVAVSSFKNKQTLQLLVDLGAQVNFKLPNLATLLHAAAQFGNVDAVEYILSMNLADVNKFSKDVQGLMPLDYADMHMLSGDRVKIQKCREFLLVEKDIADFNSQALTCYEFNDIADVSKHQVDEYLQLQNIVIIKQCKNITKFMLKLTNVSNSKEVWKCVYATYSKDYLDYYIHCDFPKTRILFPNEPHFLTKLLFSIGILQRMLKISITGLKFLFDGNNTSLISNANEVWFWLTKQILNDDLLIEHLNYCIKNGANVDAISSTLHLVIKNACSVEPVETFIKQGVDVNITDDEGNTPLHVVFSHGKFPAAEIVSLLLKHGARADALNKKGDSVLVTACNSKNRLDYKSFLLLESAGAVCNNQTANHCLYWLTFQNLPDIEFISTSKILISKNADVLWKRENGNLNIIETVFEMHGNLRALSLFQGFADFQCSTKNDLVSNEDIRVIKIMRSDFKKYSSEFVVTNEKILKLKHDENMEVEEASFTVVHVQYLTNFLFAEDKTDILIFVSYIAERGFLNGLVFLCDWYRKNVGMDLNSMSVYGKNGVISDPLHLAVSQGHFSCVEYLVEKENFRNNLFTKQFSNIVHACLDCEDGGKIIEYLAQINPALVNEKLNGVHPLASEFLHPNSFVSLMKAGADINELVLSEENVFNKNKNGCNIFHYISEFVDADFFHLLLTFLANGKLLKEFFQMQNIETGETPFHKSVQNIELKDETLKLLMTNDIDINMTTYDDKSCLLFAIESKHSLNFIKLLISSGSSLWLKEWDKLDKYRTILHYCIQEYKCTPEEFHEFVIFLSQKNLLKNFNQVDKEGNSALFYSFMFKDLKPETVDILLNSHLNVTFKNEFKQNLLHLVVLHRRNLATVKALINLGVDTQAKDIYQNTFLHYAATKLTARQFYRITMIIKERQLLSLFTLGDAHKTTPLHLAVANPKLLEIVAEHVIKEATISINCLNEIGQNILHFLQFSEDNIKYIDKFIESGVNIRQQDYKMQTPLHLYVGEATQESFCSLLKFLCEKKLLDLALIKDQNDSTLLQTSIETNKMSIEAVNLITTVETDTNLYHSLLQAAVDSSNHAILLKLIECGGSKVTTLSESGNTFFHSLCCTGGSVHEISQFLIKHGHAKMFYILDKQGFTPLHIAAQNRNLSPSTVVFLSSQGINLTVQDKSGQSILFSITNSVVPTEARGSHNIQLIRKLIESGVDFKAKNELGQTFVHSAQNMTHFEFYELVKYLVNNPPTKHIFAIEDVNCCTPIHYAVRNIEVGQNTLELLKTADVNFNAVDIYGRSLLVYAALGKRNVDILKYLIEMASVSVMVQDTDGNTFVHEIAKYYSPEVYHEIAQLLIESDNGSVFKILNYQNESPLHLAVSYMEILSETLELLTGSSNNEDGTLNSKDLSFVDLNVVDVSGYFVLHSAVKAGRSIQTTKKLIELGADCLIKTFQNRNLAHLSASVGNLEHLHLFIEHNCEINEQDNDGNTALHIAISETTDNLFSVVDFLVREGADKAQENNAGKTPYLIALEKRITDKRILDMLFF